jgi:two-component system, LytTR family, sensor histidine kinase AlgZ
MSRTGATERAAAASLETRELPDRSPDTAHRAAPASAGETASFIPDLCAARSVLAVVLIAQLLAIVLTLARPAPAGLVIELAGISMLVQWLALTSAGLICLTRGALARLAIGVAVALSFALILANTTVLSAAAWLLGDWLRERGLRGIPIPPEFLPFALRNLGIATIATGLTLRYFYVTHQWRINVRAEARSRLDALQARIRPHFLFNAMNTIASLTRRDPVQAEKAVEDLSDLLRASLSDAQSRWRLGEELELARAYQRIEQLRLGDRLVVAWDTDALPADARIPCLTVQPLLENAIRHGIEPLPAGGAVTVTGARRDGMLEISLTNPLSDLPVPAVAEGHGSALANIRERLVLAYGTGAGLAISRVPGQYRVTIRFPCET